MRELSIMIVEDEPIIAMDLQNTLRSLGYRVFDIVSSGEEALEKVGEGNPDLIIMDIVLSGVMDGIEATKLIQERFNIPVIYITAHTGGETLTRVRETSHYGYLVKPIGINDLYSSIETAIYRHEMESRLRESEERYRALVENAKDAIIVTQNGFIVYANPMATQLSGYPHQELVKKSYEEFIHPDEVEWVREQFIRRLAGEDVPDITVTRIVNSDGEIKTIEAKTAMIVWEGKPAFMDIVTDITERKLIEEELREYEDRYRALFDGSLYCVYISDFEGRFIDANKTALQLLGYTHEDITQLNFASLIDDEDLNRAFRIMGEFIEDGYHKDLSRYRLRKKDGGCVWVETDASIIYRDREPVAIQGIARDITDRVRAEEILREKDKAIASSINGIALADLSGALTYVNSSFLRMWGYDSESEVVGELTTDFWENADEAREVIEALQREENWIGEMVARRKDGSTFDVHLSASIMTDEQGTPVSMFGSFIDITERKRMEAELFDAEEKYTAIFERSFDAVFINDFRGNFIDANSRALELTGYSREDVGSLNFADFVSEDQLPMAARALEELMETGSQKTPNEYRMQREDGTFIWVETRSSVIYRGGEPYAVLGIARDITERKLAEEALRESEARYRQLVDYAPAGIIEIDIASGRFLSINDIVCDYTGFCREELLSMTPSDILTEESFTHFTDRQRQALSGELPSDYTEYRVRAKDGHELCVSTHTRLIAEGEKPVRATVIIHDITYRKRAEETLRSALHEKEVLLKEIHHRVKNNFQIIMSLLNLQKRKLTEERLVEEFSSSQNRIRAMALIHELLYRADNLSRIYFSEYIHLIARELLQGFSADKRRISLEVNAEGVHLAIDQAIPCGLIINELLTNSLKYAFPEVRDGKVAISMRADNDTVHLIVGDNGVGMPKHIDITRTETLGLKLVSLMVENQLKGSLTLDRKRGSEFIIVFPMQ